MVAKVAIENICRTLKNKLLVLYVALCSTPEGLLFTLLDTFDLVRHIEGRGKNRMGEFGGLSQVLRLGILFSVVVFRFNTIFFSIFCNRNAVGIACIVDPITQR